jgi:hypothetical protein
MLQAAILVVGLTLDGVLAALPIWVWLRSGRDPHFTDDDSVLMPSPPPDFTPALASVVIDGRASRRTISAGLMTLASENLITFVPEPSPIGHRSGLDLAVHRPRNPHLPAPEAALYLAIRTTIEKSGPIRAIVLCVLSGAFADFTRALDETAVRRGWVQSKPGAVIRKWRILAAGEALTGLLMGGVSASWASTALPESSWPVAAAVSVVGLGILVAGVVTFAVSGAMPARTKEGAMLAAMLNAYGRTLEATIAQAQSLEQVVVMRPLPWVGTPTEEIAWGVAFGLDRQIDSLLGHSLEVSEAGGWPTGLRDWFSMV